MDIINAQIEADRIAAARDDIAMGLANYLLEADASIPRLERAFAAATTERIRVESIIANDRVDRRRERRRKDALLEVQAGNFAALDDAVIGPTPEQEAKAPFVGYTAEKVEGTVRDVRTVRRLMPDRLVQLHSRGVLDDDLFVACTWYRSRWQEAGLTGAPKVARYSMAGSGGQTRTDLLPQTEAAWEAWHLYRFAKDGIPDDVRGLFELVALDGWGLADAARIARCRYANSSAAFRRGALELYDTIKHLLPIRQL